MKSNRFTKALAAGSALALAASLMCAPLAMAADQASAQGAQSRTYTYKSNEAKPAYPKTIEVDGKTFTFSSEDVRVIDEGSEKVACGMSETKQCAPGDLEATKASFADEALYDENGIKGMIPLTDLSESAVEATYTQEINRTVSYSGLPTNEVGQIPMTSEAVGESGNNVTLERAGLEFSIESTDDRGAPKTWSAVATYRGLDTVSVLDHYDVTATYAGELPTSNPVKTYELTVNYAVQESDGFGAIAGAAGAAGVVVVGAAAAFFYRRSRFRITEAKNGREKTLTRVKVNKDHEGIAVELPASILAGGGEFFGYPPSKYVGQGTALTILYPSSTGRTVIYEGPAKDRIRLGR